MVLKHQELQDLLQNYVKFWDYLYIKYVNMAGVFEDDWCLIKEDDDIWRQFNDGVWLQDDVDWL